MYQNSIHIKCSHKISLQLLKSMRETTQNLQIKRTRIEKTNDNSTKIYMKVRANFNITSGLLILFTEIPNCHLRSENQSTSRNSPETMLKSQTPIYSEAVRCAHDTNYPSIDKARLLKTLFLNLKDANSVFIEMQLVLRSLLGIMFNVMLEIAFKCHPNTQSPTPQILPEMASAPSQTPPRPPWNCDHDEQYQRHHCLKMLLGVLLAKILIIQ